jgi:enoyl-CoA hydratase/carnithine racemase
MPDTSQFNTDRTHPGRWTVTFSNPPINMFVPATIAELGVLMADLEADPSAKAIVFQSANPVPRVASLLNGTSRRHHELNLPSAT